MNAQNQSHGVPKLHVKGSAPLLPNLAKQMPEAQALMGALAAEFAPTGAQMSTQKAYWLGLNGWIKDYAANSGSIYLDYYSALAEGRNFKKELTSDGLLPNDAGYAVMAPLAEKAIATALGQK